LGGRELGEKHSNGSGEKTYRARVITCTRSMLKRSRRRDIILKAGFGGLGGREAVEINVKKRLRKREISGEPVKKKNKGFPGYERARHGKGRGNARQGIYLRR